jgi:hypothetical protein
MTSNTKSIGIAFEDQNIIGADKIYSSSELGYTTDAQGTVTQLTDKSTTVTLNKSAGRITTANVALAGATNVSFTLNNSFISANDVLIVTLSGGIATAATYNCWVNSMSAGSASITLRNITAATSLTEAVIINFALIHCI